MKIVVLVGLMWFAGLVWAEVSKEKVEWETTWADCDPQCWMLSPNRSYNYCTYCPTGKRLVQVFFNNGACASRDTSFYSCKKKIQPTPTEPSSEEWQAKVITNP